MIANVKPGHEKQIRETILELFKGGGGEQAKHADKTTLHDARFVLFDSDTRLMAGSTYEGSWDKYFEDHFASFGFDTPQSWNNWAKHCVGLPDKGARDIEEAKAWIFKYQVESVAFGVKIPNATLMELQRALKVQKAFQQVLDNPDAAKALDHPALKPLLELAAD
ncbi:MAG TPA: hypothetical protein VIX91_07830 [Candidatus Acidoferrum sp.]